MKNNRKIAVLGSSGSIGRQTLDVAKRYDIGVEALAVNTDIKTAEAQAREFLPRFVSVTSVEKAKELASSLADTNIKVFGGKNALFDMIASLSNDCDTILNSLVGTAGLLPTLAAIDCKKNIALANKETLVTGGELVMSRVHEAGVTLLPVDSEHCAIHQCLRSGKKEEVKKLILTASGGPFFGKKREELASVTVDDALAHPTWSMGRKITVDSATLMNKGFELIEAAHLFGTSADDIDVVVHRESVIHSMVGYRDGSVIAQMGFPDMRTCIAYALFGGEHMEGVSKLPSFADIARLTFAEPDEETFTCLPLAKYAFKMGGTLPAVLNAANDRSVELFLENKIKFTDIMDLTRETVHKYSKEKCREAYNRLSTAEEISISAEEGKAYIDTLIN